MNFNFSFFGTNDHRVFNYKPRYLDEEKQQRQEIFGKVDGSAKKETYVPGSYLRGSFTGENSQLRRGNGKAQKFIGLIALVLAFAIIFLVVKMWPLMMAALGAN